MTLAGTQLERGFHQDIDIYAQQIQDLRTSMVKPSIYRDIAIVYPED